MGFLNKNLGSCIRWAGGFIVCPSLIIPKNSSFCFTGFYDLIVVNQYRWQSAAVMKKQFV
jgi:hypothetical protein